MRLGIVGTRTFDDYNKLRQNVSMFDTSMIITGDADGADTLAAMYGIEHDIPVARYSADWTTFGKRAGPIRNMFIVDECDMLLAFWDGKSPGTRNSIQRAMDKKKPFLVVRVTPDVPGKIFPGYG